MKIEVGEFLQECRTEAGLNKSELARKIKCTPGFVWHVENDLSLPKAKLLKRYLKAVKLDPNEFKAHVTKVVATKLESLGV